MKRLIMAVLAVFLISTSRTTADQLDTQFNSSLTWNQDGITSKYIHREAYFAHLRENEVNIGARVSDNLTLYGAYITNNQGVDRAGIVIAISQPLDSKWHASASLHLYKGLNSAPDRFKWTLVIAKPVSKHWLVGIYNFGNSVHGNPNKYWEGGPALIYRNGATTIPIFFLLKDEGRKGIQANLNFALK
ncbi:MAG: hypothetical protein Q7S37_04765 [bacterium]|nr:hypothetical protein [bacterium]